MSRCSIPGKTDDGGFKSEAQTPLWRSARVSQALQQEMEAASRGAVAASGFALEAHRTGRLLREQPQYAVGFVDVGGWDTHAGQRRWINPARFLRR